MEISEQQTFTIYGQDITKKISCRLTNHHLYIQFVKFWEGITKTMLNSLKRLIQPHILLLGLADMLTSLTTDMEQEYVGHLVRNKNICQENKQQNS